MSSDHGLFFLLPHGPLWKSEDVKSMMGFMDEFNRRAERESDSPQLLCVFDQLIETLGVEAATEALDRVKEQRQQQQQQQQQQVPDHLKIANNTPASSTAAYAMRTTTGDGMSHQQEDGAHTGQGTQAAETLQTLMRSHVGGKGLRSSPSADERREMGGQNDGGDGGGVGGIDAFHSETVPSEGSPSHSLSLSPLGNNTTGFNPSTAAAMALQQQATLYAGNEGTAPSPGASSPASFASTSAAATSDGNPPVVPPATLSWAGVPPIPATLPSLQAPTLRMPIPPVAYTFEGVTRHFATTTGDNGTETAADVSKAAKPETPAAAASRKRTRSSSSSGTATSASASAPVPAPAAASSLAAAVSDDGYIPTPRNDGPWHYLGNLPASATASASSSSAGGGGGGGGGGGEASGGGAAAAALGAGTSGGSASSGGSDEEGAKSRPAAMNFGRYGDHLPYNGRKVCRVKNCDGNQRWPDYLCGQHGGGRCRWEGCTLFHQGINSMGLLLCGKHCKAVGATYRRPRAAANQKTDGGGGGGGGGSSASSSGARKRK